MADHLAVVEACAARNDGERDMLDTGVIGAGYFVGADTGRRTGDLSHVRAISIDTLCATLDFHPTHVKIDVEGDELDVIRGASILLAPERRPIIFLEIHNVILRSRGQDPREIVEHLEGLGYECHDVSSGRVDSLTFEREVSRLVAEPRIGLPPA